MACFNKLCSVLEVIKRNVSRNDKNDKIIALFVNGSISGYVSIILMPRGNTKIIRYCARQRFF